MFSSQNNIVPDPNTTISSYGPDYICPKRIDYRLTHFDLIDLAIEYLLFSGYSVTCSEISAVKSSERPDAIGFNEIGHSMLIECKASVEDFLADSVKSSRNGANLALGLLRYYLITEELESNPKFTTLPSGWGLLVVSPNGYVRMKKRA